MVLQEWRYQKFALAQRTQIAKHKKALVAGRLKNADTNARGVVETASANAEGLVAAAGDDASFKAASTSVAELEKTLNGFRALEVKSKKYKAFAQKKRAAIAKHKKAIVSAQKKAAISAAKLAIEQAVAKAESTVASATDEAGFKAADAAVAELEKALGQHRGVETKSPKYLKYAKAKRGAAAKFKKTLAQARQKASEDAAKLAVEQALANAQGQVSAATDKAGFTAASTSIAALQKALDDNKDIIDNAHTQ